MKALRQKVLAAALRGDRTICEVADSFGVGTTFVDKVLALHRAGQDLAPRPHGGGYPARLLPWHEKLLRSQVRRHKDATLEELRAHLEAEVSASHRARDEGRQLRVVQTLRLLTRTQVRAAIVSSFFI